MTELIEFSDSFRWQRHVLTVLCGSLLLTVLSSSAVHGREKDAMAIYVPRPSSIVHNQLVEETSDPDGPAPRVSFEHRDHA